MGVLDDVLRPHLESVTKCFKSDENTWRTSIDSIRNMEISDSIDPRNAAQNRLQLDRMAENFREQGNAFFKALDYPKAQLLYTQSIAAAIGGPLGSLAYFNRSEIKLKSMRELICE